MWSTAALFQLLGSILLSPEYTRVTGGSPQLPSVCVRVCVCSGN